MTELTDRERDYAKKVTDLQFRNATFNLQEIIESAKEIGYQAVHEIMLDLLAENVERQKKSIPLVGLRMTFRKRANNFGAKQQHQIEQDNRKLDWEAHLKQIEAEQEAGFTASDDQLVAGLVAYRDANKETIDEEAYTRGLKFLDLIMRSKDQKPVDQTA